MYHYCRDKHPLVRISGWWLYKGTAERNLSTRFSLSLNNDGTNDFISELTKSFACKKKKGEYLEKTHIFEYKEIYVQFTFELIPKFLQLSPQLFVQLLLKEYNAFFAEFVKEILTSVEESSSSSSNSSSDSSTDVGQNSTSPVSVAPETLPHPPTIAARSPAPLPCPPLPCSFSPPPLTRLFSSVPSPSTPPTVRPTLRANGFVSDHADP